MMDIRTCLFLTIISFYSYESGVTASANFGKTVDAKTVARLYETSFRDCLEECRRRPACQSVSYLRRFLLCRLKEFIDPDNYKVLLRRKAVNVMVKDYSEMGEVSCGAAVCTGSDVCDSVREQCIVKECEILNTPNNGQVMGNTLSIGSKAVLDCNIGTYYPVYQDLPALTVCHANGTWTITSVECYEDYYYYYK